MAVTPLRIELEASDCGVDSLGALWEPAAARRREGHTDRSALLLAHGAGAGPEHPLLAAISRGLAEAGLSVLRFRYPYRERMEREGTRRPPDRMSVLEAAHQAALAELERLAPRSRVLLAGKSMGGRVGSHLAAKGASCRGLVLIGYPLHPAGRPEKERSEHFPAIAQPALFLQGTRDALCELPRLARALERYGGRATLSVIEGADHDFKRPGRGGADAQAAARELVSRIDGWESATFPS
jgi:uncharacterized protein